MYGRGQRQFSLYMQGLFNKQYMKLLIMGLNQKGKKTYNLQDQIANKKTQCHLTRHVKHGNDEED